MGVGRLKLWEDSPVFRGAMSAISCEESIDGLLVSITIICEMSDDSGERERERERGN